MQLIDKAAVVAEMERRLNDYIDEYKHCGDIYASVLIDEVVDILSFLNTLELKEVDLEKKNIDAEKLKDKIKSLQCEQGFEDGEAERGYQIAIKNILNIITSLQQEQPEMDIVSTAKVFLDVLSKTPYNNKPITDAQIIVKQLLLFFETPSKYNPDAIVEQSKVDLNS